MSIEESEYLGIVQAIYAMPLIIDVSGRRTRSDFLYIDTKTGIPSLYLYDNGESTMISPGDQPITGSIALHNTNPWVAYAKDVGGAEDFAVYLLDYSKDEVTQVTKGTIGRINKLFWVTDDTWIVVGCDKQEYYIRLLHRDGSTEPLFLTDEQILTAAYDEKRNRVIAAVGRGPGTRIAVIDAHRTVTWVSESDTSEDTHPFICSEPEYLAYTTDVSGSTEIVVRTLSTLQEITRVEVPGSIGFLPGEGNIFWVDSKTIFAAVAKDAQLSPQLLDVTTGKWSHPLADISVLASTCTKEGPLWIGSSFSQPLSVQTLRNQKVVTVIQPDYTGTYVQSESHWYTSFDGQKIQGWLLRNPDPEAPLLVFCHGGPNFATLNMWAQGVLELVLAGYHVFAPNFRGSTTFGAEFKNLNIGDIGGGDLQDVLYGARYAMKVLGITRKPGIVGGSYGGYLTMQALTTQPDEWAGGVALVPWVDLIETHELGDAHYKALDTYLLGGTPEEKPELYRDRSPSTHLEKLKSPVLMIAGENDSRCPLPPIKNLYEKAQQLNLPVKLEVIKQEGHGAVQISNLILFIILQLEFLKTLFPR